MELSDYYVSCVGYLCKTVKQELYGVKMAPKLFVVEGVYNINIFIHREIK